MFNRMLRPAPFSTQQKQQTSVVCVSTPRMFHAILQTSWSWVPCIVIQEALVLPAR
jgi:hypothetical protein